MNLSKVFFSSVPGAGYISFSPIAQTDSDIWKLTLNDGNDDFEATRVDADIKDLSGGTTVNIEVSSLGSVPDGLAYSQISAMLVDNNYTVLAYGKISDGDVAATGNYSFQIPSQITTAASLYIFAEAVNSGTLTDYASSPVVIAGRLPESGTNNISTAFSHTHHFEWVTTKEPTVTEDGEEEFRCSCGEVEVRNIIPANVFYIKDMNRQLIEAAQNGTIEYDAGWNSCISDYVLKKIADRPDVTLVITFEYQKKKYKLTIPAGTDVTTLLQDGEQIYGFFGLANKLGLEVGKA